MKALLRCLFALMLAVGACGRSPTQPSTAGPPERLNVLSFSGHPLDWVTLGQSRRIDSTTHRFSGVHSPFSGVDIQVTPLDTMAHDDWSLNLSAGSRGQLMPGHYVREQATAENGLTNPVLRFGGPSRGCGATGEFDVLEARFNTDGSIVRFHATFSQLCDGNFPAPIPTTGEIRVSELPTF
jgi:hypothetical protein